MNTVTVAITLPQSGASPYDYSAALVQAISQQSVSGNMIAAAAIGGLLSLINIGISHVAPVKS